MRCVRNAGRNVLNAGRNIAGTWEDQSLETSTAILFSLARLVAFMMNDPNLAPGVSQNDLDGPACDQCGRRGCDCEDDGDPRTYRERIEDDKADLNEG